MRILYDSLEVTEACPHDNIDARHLLFGCLSFVALSSGICHSSYL